MTLEQLHEQNKEIIKGVGGATRLISREEEATSLIMRKFLTKYRPNSLYRRI